MSFGSSNKTTTTNQASQTDPWAAAVPQLKDWLSSLQSKTQTGTVGATSTQGDAFKQLEANAATAPTNAGQISQLATDQLNTPDRTGTATQGYSTLQNNLSSVAAGKNQDLSSDPYLQKALQTTSDNAQNAVKAQFAAAGRDFSGADQKAQTQGIINAQAPMLENFFQQQQGRTDAANNTLYNAGNSTAGTLASLDAAKNAIQTQGISTTSAAQAAQNYAPNTILNLEQQQKQLPYQDLQTIASLLFPAAGLGSQSTGTGTANTNGSQWGLGIGDVGKGIGALAGLF